MELFIVRHGQSIGNLIVEDMPDGELTELGRQQGAKVGECLKDANIGYIIASPLVRAIETAQPLAQALQLPIEVWKETYEVRNKGAYTGPSTKQLCELYPETRFNEDMEPDGWYCSGDEDAEAGHLRATRIYDQLCSRFEGKRVAVFAHGGFNRHLLLVALGLPYDSPVYFHQNNGCIYWLSVSPERTVLNYVGDTRVILDGENEKKPKLA